MALSGVPLESLFVPGLQASGHLRVTLLGSFGMFAERLKISLSVGSARLVALLALRGHGMSRSLVAGTLWPESTDARAHACLRSAVARLRPADQSVDTTPREICLTADASVDLHDARSLAYRILDGETPTGPPSVGMHAVQALSADLLPGWYDDWILLEAEDWRQLRLHALEALSDRFAHAGRFAEATAAAVAAIKVEPLRESSCASLIRVHQAEGNHCEAVRAYERFRALLRAELDLAPTENLQRLLARS